MSLVVIVQWGAWYLVGCKDFHCVFPVFYVFVSHGPVFIVMFFLCVAKIGWDREVVGCQVLGVLSVAKFLRNMLYSRCLCYCVCMVFILVCCKDWVGQGEWRLPGGT